MIEQKTKSYECNCNWDFFWGDIPCLFLMMQVTEMLFSARKKYSFTSLRQQKPMTLSERKVGTAATSELKGKDMLFTNKNFTKNNTPPKKNNSWKLRLTAGS